MLSKALEKPYEKNEHVMDKNSGDCSWSDFNRRRRSNPKFLQFIKRSRGRDS